MNRFVLFAAALLLAPHSAFGQTAPTYQGSDGQTKEALGTFPLTGSSTAPSSSAASSITPVVGSLVASIPGKASPGNLYGVSVTTGAAAVYLYVFNATTAPADGAVVAGNASGNYQYCTAVAATTTMSSTFDVPERYSVGITPVVSSAACGTLTKTATAVFIKSRAQ